jgi:hypothetical protein
MYEAVPTKSPPSATITASSAMAASSSCVCVDNHKKQDEKAHFYANTHQATGGSKQPGRQHQHAQRHERRR